jgi:hypothetical protein
MAIYRILTAAGRPRGGDGPTLHNRRQGRRPLPQRVVDPGDEPGLSPHSSAMGKGLNIDLHSGKPSVQLSRLP